MNRHATQQVRIDFMSRLLLTGVGLAIQRRHTHPLHQGFDLLATDRDALVMQLIAQHSRPHERVFQMQFIQPPHQVQITLRDGFGQIIDATPAHIEQVGLG